MKGAHFPTVFQGWGIFFKTKTTKSIEGHGVEIEVEPAPFNVSGFFKWFLFRFLFSNKPHCNQFLLGWGAGGIFFFVLSCGGKGKPHFLEEKRNGPLFQINLRA